MSIVLLLVISVIILLSLIALRIIRNRYNDIIISMALMTYKHIPSQYCACDDDVTSITPFRLKKKKQEEEEKEEETKTYKIVVIRQHQRKEPTS